MRVRYFADYNKSVAHAIHRRMEVANFLHSRPIQSACEHRITGTHAIYE